MRRLCPPSLSALVLLGALALPVLPASASTDPASPTPTATATAASRPAVRLTDADAGRTLRVVPGTQLHVRLAAPGSGDVWEGLELGGPTLHVVRYASDADGLEVDLDVLSPRSQPQSLRAQTDAACFSADQPCARPSKVWEASVVVDAGPTDTSAQTCLPAPRPQPSPAPGTVVATAADDGRTVQVPRDGRLVVDLEGCTEPVWAAPRADRLLFRSSTSVVRTHGEVRAVFLPQAAGTATVTAGTDARCLHRTDASGDGECAVGQRAYSLTVEVTPASACPASIYEALRVSPRRVAAGDPVQVSGGRDDPCVDDAQEPERAFTLLARPQGGEEAVVQTVRARFFRSTVRPATTTTYRLLMDGREVRPEGDGTTVVVDRTYGSCATSLALTGPARAVAGSSVRLSGRAPAGETVQVLFRRYGQAAYAVRRTVVAGPDGSFSASWTASDDHRWYARTARCDTPPGLTKAAPRVVGPAVVRRGETVVLHVTAVHGVRTTVFFRGAGEPFSARRTLTGPGTVSYVAHSDQRYYALTRDTISNHGLTQVR